jgi:hypothetical protein
MKKKILTVMTLTGLSALMLTGCSGLIIVVLIQIS